MATRIGVNAAESVTEDEAYDTFSFRMPGPVRRRVWFPVAFWQWIAGFGCPF